MELDKKFWDNAQEQEAITWNRDNAGERKEKIEREFIRYPKLIKDLNLPYLDLTDKTVVEIGAGPISVLTCLRAAKKIAVEPLWPKYAEYFELAKDIEWHNSVGEHTGLEYGIHDVVLIINALDHMCDPAAVIAEALNLLKPSGYLGVITCIDNALHNPHPAHKINIDGSLLHLWVDPFFETCHELNYAKDDYRYGWRPFKGKIGTPAIAWLGRKVTGYPEEER